MSVYSRRLLLMDKGYSGHSMLAHPVFKDISIDTYKWLRCGINYQHSVLAFHLENTNLQKIYLGRDIS